MSMNLHSWQPSHTHPNYYFSRNIGDGQNSAFIAHENPSLFVRNGEYIDGVFITDDTSEFRTNRHTFGNQLGQHNNWDPYRSYHQFIYVATDDVNEIIVAMQNLDRSRLSGQQVDYRALLDLPAHHTEIGHQEEEEEEEIFMMKTRSHCANKVEVDTEEICSICLCEYVNDETIGTLECGHEYHANCIEQWLLRGKKNCPICRSSVLPSQQHTQS